MTNTASASGSSVAPAYVSHVSVRRMGGADKAVMLPAETGSMVMGVHSEIAAHLGVSDHPPHASTMDFLVGATAACLAGTFGRALEARGITLPLECHQVEAEGEVRDFDGVLVVTRIVVTHRVHLAREQHPVCERVLKVYDRACSMSRSLEGSVDIVSRLEFV